MRSAKPSRTNRKSRGPMLGPLESEVMDVLWREGECSVRMVMQRLGRRIAYTTVLTTMVRLFRKELLERREFNRRFLYFPRITAEEWRRRVAHSALVNFQATPHASPELLANCLIESLVQNPGLWAEVQRQMEAKRSAISASRASSAMRWM